MAGITPQEASVRALQSLNLPGTAESEIWKVLRLDRPGSSYYLVVFRQGAAAIAAAIVDATAGEILQSVRLSGSVIHLPVNAETARGLAELNSVESIDLVWQPCQASLSPFYPFWRVASVGKTVFIDQQRRRWSQLPPAGPG